MVELNKEQQAELYRVWSELGAKRERDRIIQIIEKRKAYDCTCSCDCHSDTSPCTACKADNELIEIIKGENK